MEDVLYEDGLRKAICTISTRSKTLYELSRKIVAQGYGHDDIYRVGLEALDKEKEGEN